MNRVRDVIDTSHSMIDCQEDQVWKTVNPNDLWVMDKLILSRKLGYTCGPTGQDVPVPNNYIVRPCVNMLGLGLGASIEYLKDDTCHLPLGYFWCEIFQGQHLSIDYKNKEPVLSVEGIKSSNTLTKWTEWRRTDIFIPFPDILNNLQNDYEYINCEFINGNLIEVHLRQNEDFKDGISHFIPVWKDESITPPTGYRYIEYPDLHGRIGAFVK